MSEERSMGDLEKAACLLQKANTEIDRLRQLLRDVYEKIIMVDPEEATEEQQLESISIVKRVREATKDE